MVDGGEKLVENLIETARNDETPIAARTRCLFLLQAIDSESASSAIQRCISGESLLLDHEIAYVLGQIHHPNALDFLLSLADDSTVHPIVRHEAIEALGNYNDPNLIPKLQHHAADECDIIKESAMLAINKLKANSSEPSEYGSYDPASPFRGTFQDAVNLLENGTLYEKYSAIFYFRNQNTKEAVEALSAGFKDKSSLLRHEIAFVYGQMQNPEAVDTLVRVLEDSSEAEIVRHEAAESLGNIGTEKCIETLKKFTNAEIRILRESAEVGLEIAARINEKDSYDTEEEEAALAGVVASLF